MVDIQKVIKGLERLRDICNAKSNMAIGNGRVAWAGCANTADDARALLKEQDAEIKRLKGELHGFGDLFKTLSEKTEKVIDEQQKIVRCKDCKNADYGTDEDGNRFMKCIGSVKCYGGTTPDFFCADGKRKETK